MRERLGLVAFDPDDAGDAAAAQWAAMLEDARRWSAPSGDPSELLERPISPGEWIRSAVAERPDFPETLEEPDFSVPMEVVDFLAEVYWPRVNEEVDTIEMRIKAAQPKVPKARLRFKDAKLLARFLVLPVL